VFGFVDDNDAQISSSKYEEEGEQNVSSFKSSVAVFS